MLAPAILMALSKCQFLRVDTEARCSGAGRKSANQEHSHHFPFQAVPVGVADLTRIDHTELCARSGATGPNAVVSVAQQIFAGSAGRWYEKGQDCGVFVRVPARLAPSNEGVPGGLFMIETQEGGTSRPHAGVHCHVDSRSRVQS